MPVITVLYPSEGSSNFDESYYMATHMPLVRKHWGPMGLSDTKVMRGIPGPDGVAPTYTVVTMLTFGSMDQFKQAAGAHGKEIFADIPNFTDGKPVIQFNDPVS